MKHTLSLALAFALSACGTSVDLGGAVDAGDRVGDDDEEADESEDGDLAADAGKNDDAGTLTVCTPGQDHTCNADMAMSALAGTCNANGTCTCKSGFAINAAGKCALSGADDPEGSCATADTTEACVTCCQRPPPSIYGGFELYGYNLCLDCPACQDGSGPCGGNVDQAAGKACVQCLQEKMAMGVPSPCATQSDCNAFAICMQECPLR